MWRQNTLRHNPDSDQSISDEDDIDEPDKFRPNDVVSFLASATASDKEELSLPLRLDFLKGISNQDLAGKGGSCLSIEEPRSTPLEDEVEMPDFHDGNVSDISGAVVANSSDDEVISKDEVDTVLSTRKHHKYGLRYQVRGIYNKVKPRISSSSLSHKCGRLGPSLSSVDRLPEIMKTVELGAPETFDGNHLGDDDGVELSSGTEPAETEALARGLDLPSMADIFENLQDKTSLYFPHSESRRETGSLVQQRNRSQLSEIIADSEDSPELVDSGSSSDDEVSDPKMKITFPGKKMQTMADRFQEALGSSSVITERTHVAIHNSLRPGIYGKLQQVMQKEKERDMDFLKNLQTGARPGELACVDIKIISRYLDGKLTICRCSFGKLTENQLLLDNSEGMGFGDREITVIFSPRVCDNVDLEVGNLIRIHSPWKEIQVGNGNIILCTYFSQI